MEPHFRFADTPLRHERRRILVSLQVFNNSQVSPCPNRRMVDVNLALNEFGTPLIHLASGSSWGLPCSEFLGTSQSQAGRVAAKELKLSSLMKRPCYLVYMGVSNKGGPKFIPM